MEIAVVLEALEAAGAAARQEHIEDRAGRVDLEFVVARLVVGGLEEQLEDVVVPEHAVVFLDVGVEVGVLHVGEEIEIFAIPEQLRFRLGLGGAGVLAEPGKIEIVDGLGVLPRCLRRPCR